MSITIRNAQVCSPLGYWQQGWLSFEEGRISAFGQGDSDASVQINADGLLLMPGLIDLHIHGSAGHDVMDATPEALAGMAGFLVKQGVTAFLPTTLTNTAEKIGAALQNIQAAMQQAPLGAKILGAHLEGPYLNVAQCGAQNPQYIRRADPDEALPWLDLGVIRLLDLAPEYVQNHWLLEACTARDIRVSVAHSSATYEQVCQAAAQGLQHATHTFNAMSGFHHREVGVVGAVLTLPNITCELIADNIHVHPAAMRLAWQMKKPHNLILISDAVRAAGLPDGKYDLDGREVLLADGAVRLPDGTLAGSALTLNRALWNFAQALSLPLYELWPTASLNAARALGLDRFKGSLDLGKDADLILVDEEMRVYLTVIAGQIVYQDPSLEISYA